MPKRSYLSEELFILPHASRESILVREAHGVGGPASLGVEA